jgi:uncharacterized protein YndB with AHSA1/START domain
MQAQPDPSDSLVFECDFEEPPEKVWRALTEPRLLEAWLTTDDAPRMPSGNCEILTAEPHRFLRYRWRDRADGPDDSGGREVHSVVTVELAPCPTGGTHLRLTHGEFRVVSAVPTIFFTRVTPIMDARRRRTPILSCAGQVSWRRAA